MALTPGTDVGAVERHGESRLQTLATSLFMIVLLLLPSSAWTQPAPPGQLIGTVTDPDHAVVPGAPVAVTNRATHARLTTVTNDRGVYTFQSLEPGRYVVEARREGFAPSVSPELYVAAGRTVTANLALVVAGTSETVNVTAGSVENAYRVDRVSEGGPLGTTPILNLPYTVT